MKADISKWAMRNMLMGSDGLRVRPGIVELGASLGLTGVKAAFTERDEATDAVRHVVVTYASGVAKVFFITDQFRYELIYDWGDRDPGHVTWAFVAGQVVLASENCPTLWWYTGSAPAVARGKAWDQQPELEPIEIPRGMVTEWAGRAVYYDGGQLYFSEGDEPRMLFADNVQNAPGGRICGMHAMSGGALLIATTTGVWALSREAATAGEFIIGSWQKITDYNASRPGTTVSAKGRVWGLSRRGVRLIDSDSNFEVELNDPSVPMTTGDPVCVHDYQDIGRLTEGAYGFQVSVPELGMTYHNDHASRTGSWWSHTDGWNVVGNCYRRDGTWLPVTSGGIYRCEGSREEDDATVYGVAAGRVGSTPERSPVVREIHVSTDTSGSAVVALRGEQKTASPPQSGTLWNQGTYGTSKWTTPPVRSRRLQFATRTDDIAIEVGASGPGSRVDPVIDIQIRGVGRNRPTN